jgi:hypothetical protein
MADQGKTHVSVATPSDVMVSRQFCVIRMPILRGMTQTAPVLAKSNVIAVPEPTFVEHRMGTGTVKLTGLRRPLTISDAGKAVSKEDGDALEDHDRGHG